MRVTYSPKAKEDLERIISFLSTRWPESVIDHLLDGIDEEMEKITKFPEVYPILDGDKKARKCLVRLKTLMFYEVNEDEISITAFYDGRENYQDKEQWK